MELLFYINIFWCAHLTTVPVFSSFHMNQNWVQESILALLWPHFNLVFWMRRVSNQQPLDCELSTLTTRLYCHPIFGTVAIKIWFQFVGVKPHEVTRDARSHLASSPKSFRNNRKSSRELSEAECDREIRMKGNLPPTYLHEHQQHRRSKNWSNSFV